jgi:long-subunit fatty acid transport protein
MLVTGKLNGNISQTDQMAAMSKGIINFGDHPYDDNDIGWLSVMGWNTWLTFVDQTITTTKPNENPYMDDKGNQIVDGEGNPLYIDDVLFGGFGTSPMTAYSARERGGLNNYDFNLAFNFYDRFYIGATLGFADVDYSRNSVYRESSDEGSYSLENWFDTKGLGVNFKVGTIFRVTNNFRIGAAIHIPTFYRLTDYHGAILISEIDGKTYKEDTYKQAAEVKTEYKLVTPWKFNASLGYTIGQNVALGAEYEYQNRSTAKLKYDDGVHMSGENQMIKTGLKSVHTFRLGAEFRVAPGFSLRAGYNYITSPMYADTFKKLPINTVRTDTEFSNIKGLSNYTLGFGYRGSQYYADIAYKYQTNKENFYAFDHVDLPATKVDNNTHQVLMTLGMRF